MSSDKEGNKGIKRKSEESVEKSPNKHICSADGGSTSTGITHKDQGGGNVEKITWMKCCKTDDFGANPQCTLCGGRYPLYINSATMKEHLDKKHAINIDEENESPDWIFRYYRPISGLKIRCYLKNCKQELEYAKFEGSPFVEHFDEGHEKMAKQRFQGDNENAKVTKEGLTKKFVLHLYDVYKKNKEGNENKKKYEKSEEAEGNVRNINWMKVCKIDNIGLRPRCDICQERHSFSIESRTFKDHLIEKHDKIIDDENESPDWIFNYYTPIPLNARYLTCNSCRHVFEVLTFVGSFVNHFNPQHDEEAEQRNEVGYEDMEEVKRDLTKQFVNYLYIAFTRKAVHDVRYKAWWMEHVKEPENNKLFCDITGCSQPMKPFHVWLGRFDFKAHIPSCHPELQSRRDVNIWDYILFDDYLLRCRRCDEILTYSLGTHYVTHLRDMHNITSSLRVKGNDPVKTLQEINKEEELIDYINKLIQYLVENYRYK